MDALLKLKRSAELDLKRRRRNCACANGGTANLVIAWGDNSTTSTLDSLYLLPLLGIQGEQTQHILLESSLLFEISRSAVTNTTLGTCIRRSTS